MRKSKNRGFALIYVICVIMLLSALTLSALLLLSTNRITTAHIERTDKAKLAAETGIDKGISALKAKIAKDDWKQYLDIQENPAGNYKFDVPDNIADTTLESGASYKVEFDNAASYKDTVTETDKKCIKITSTGKYQLSTQTIEAYIDVANISNAYFNRMFNSTLTSIDSNKENSGDFTFNNAMEDGAIPLNSDTVKNNSDGKSDLMVYKYDNTSDTPKKLDDIVSNMYTDIENGIASGKVNSEISIDNIEESWIPTSEMLKNAKTQEEIDRIKDYSLDDYIKIKNSKGTNDFENMLQYSTFYKIIFIKGDIEVGDLNRPLVNYIIYCDGSIKFNSSNPSYFWNCNIYAKSITTQNGTVYKLNDSQSIDNAGDANSNIAYYDKNEQKVIFRSNGEETSPQPNIEIMGINSDKAKTSILKHIMNYDVDSQPYTRLENYYNAIDATKHADAVFPASAAGEFNPADRVAVNKILLNNINEYAYGLKFRIIGWIES